MTYKTYNMQLAKRSLLKLEINIFLVAKDTGLNVQEIPFRWIWLKICILMYFEALSNV